ncbi:hypothetical protein PEBR_09984 [Penicillium brasilianum]|uniref:Clr5 domain-containing protein n=1 Tax=Penicillium brasilianum TaxID=104259 RepID=A0A1S9RTX6_PENBI|nr:hypothetical protein PEBR_09984 [Penicillium brasilianum]
MPRQQINLEPYRDEIITLFQHGISSDSISRTLESRYNIQVKERTIQSRLRKWGIRKRSRTTTADEVLHARIKVLFMQDRLTDKAMLKLLRQDGYDISERTLRRLRFQLGLHARASTFDQERGSGPIPVPFPVAMRPFRESRCPTFGNGSPLRVALVLPLPVTSPTLLPICDPYATKQLLFYGFLRVFFPTRQFKDSYHRIACSKFYAAGSALPLKA